MELHYIKTESDLENLLEQSESAKVFLLKHSTRCEVSEKAFHAYESFAKSNDDTKTYVVRVIEERALSQRVAELAEITHKSPQVLVFLNRKVVWNDSHFNLTEEALKNALFG